VDEHGIRRDEILSLSEYEKVRDERLRAIIELKRHRRVAVGGEITFIFENRQTAWFQIHEILRAERIDGEAGIREQIEAYDVLIPRPGELRATMMIEIPDREERNRRLPELVGIEEAVSLHIGDDVVGVRFHFWRETATRASPVNYAMIPVGEGRAAAFAAGGPPIRLVIRHPRYRAEAELSDSTRAALARDLSASGSPTLLQN